MPAFTVPIAFTGIDRYTAVMRKMTSSTLTFKKKAELGFNAVARAEQRMRKGIGRSIGMFGRLGVTIGALGIGTTIVQANVLIEKNMASLSAITGATGKQLEGFADEVERVSKVEKKFGADTAKAFELVGSAQPELLKSAEALGEVTQAAIILSKASSGELAQSAKDLTGTMNQFGLAANQSARVMNVLAAGAKEGSATILQLSESMDRVGAIAKGSNLSLEQTVAAIELLSKFNLKGSEAGISLKTTLLRLKSASLGFASGQFNLNDALEEYNKQATDIKDPIKKAAFEEKIFGKEHILTGQILTKNIDRLNALTKAVTGTNEATKQASINSDTLSNRWAELVNSFKNAVTTTDKTNTSLNLTKDILVFIADNMSAVLITIGSLIASYVLFRGVIIAATAVSKINNVIMGISAALHFRTAESILKNVAAMKIAEATTVTLKAATMAYKAVLNALRGPIGWITLALGALTLGYFAFIKANKTAQSEINKFGASIKTNLIIETQKMNELFEALKRTNPASERRKEILAEINKLQPGLINQNKLLTGSIEQITTAQNEATKALRRNIIEQMTADKIKNELTLSAGKQTKALELLFDVGKLSTNQAAEAFKRFSELKPQKGKLQWELGVDVLKDLGVPESKIKDLSALGVFGKLDEIIDLAKGTALSAERIALIRKLNKTLLLSESGGTSRDESEAVAPLPLLPTTQQSIQRQESIEKKESFRKQFLGIDFSNLPDGTKINNEGDNIVTPTFTSTTAG